MLILLYFSVVTTTAQDNRFVKWNTDGTSETVNVPYEKDPSGDVITNIINVGDAAAVDLSTIADIMKTTTIGEWIVRTLTYTFTASTNPNCLYFVDDETDISDEMAKSLEGLNVVKGTHAGDIALEDGFPFFTPRDFTADHIRYERLFGKGNERGVGGGWQSIVLPFDVQVVSVDGNEKKWFSNANDDADFWVFKLVGNDGNTAKFGYNSEGKMVAANPYIVAVPDDSWAGSECSLEGKTLVFGAENVAVSKASPAVVESGNLCFAGTFSGVSGLTNAYVLNDEGTFFAANTTVNPFNAYVQKNNGSSVGARVNIGFTDDVVTGIKGVNMKADSNAVHDAYDLQGRRIKSLKANTFGSPSKGVYIIKGKKVVIK
jgi:putative flippase GtrA